MPVTHFSTIQQDIISDLRTEICLDDGSSKLVLYESEIAKRYGVSRTPVRHVLQYLAQTQMVTTQHGVGTVVVPLEEDKRSADFRAYAAISKACSLFLAGVEMRKQLVVDISSLQTWVTLLDSRSTEEFLLLNKRVAEILTSMVPDELLQHAYSAAHWRLIRWRVRDIRQHGDLPWIKLEERLAEAIKIAQTRNAANLMALAAQIGNEGQETADDVLAKQFKIVV